MVVIKKFGELEPGDYVQGVDRPVQVTKVYQAHLPKSMFRLTFDDGTQIDASGNHLWYVETNLDRRLHRRRVKTFRKLFSPLPEHVTSSLVDILRLEYEHTEIAVVDILEFLGVTEAGEKADAIVRVADSIGHVLEENTIVEDLATGDEVEYEKTRIYDAKRFAQQILALSDRKWEKKYPIIKGRVVTTEQLTFMVDSGVNIPEVKQLDGK